MSTEDDDEENTQRWLPVTTAEPAGPGGPAGVPVGHFERLATLARASEVLASSLDYEVTLRNVVALALPALGDFGFFDVDEGLGGVRRLPHAHNDPRRQALLEKTRWVRFERDDVPVCALSSGRSGHHPYVDDAWIRKVALDSEHENVLRELALGSMITVPLLYQSRRLGGLTLCFAANGRHHSKDELALAEELARRAAAAVENARLYRDLKHSEDRARRAYEAAQEADRRKDEFLAMLGHELRNPLAPILTALKLMELREPKAFPKERTIIERQVRHLVTLVDDLLDISRITRGKVELKKERLLLSEVATKAVEMASPLLDQRGHSLQIEVSPGLGVVADQARLAQVVANLLTNAAKYTESGGHIWLQGVREGDEVVIRVRDTGTGIPAHLLPRMFDTFVQGDRPLDRSQGGLGLGLAIVKSLVELHGGRVSAHSEGTGRGSEFMVRLPALDQEAVGAAPIRRAAAPRAAKVVRRVLVVDDNEDAADLLAEALRTMGHEAKAAYDGPQALEAARGFDVELAVLDLGLPVMDGYELARQLREKVGPGLRLVALTGYGQEADRARSRDAGFAEHLVKPVDLEMLRTLVEGR